MTTHPRPLAAGETTGPADAPASTGQATGAAHPVEPPSKRYGATVRLIQSRMADAERTKAKPWWKWKRHA